MTDLPIQRGAPLELPARDDGCSCPDYSTSRRALLRNIGLVSAGAVTTTMFGETFRQTAYGATTDGNVMVVLSLRGGADSLSMVVPKNEPAYTKLRPHIAVPESTLICQDASFGLHPSFAPLRSMWQKGQFGVVLATGLPVPNRSHFDAIEQIEDADLGSDARTGWINRLIGLDGITSPLEAVQVGSGLMPTSLMGSEPALSIEETDDISLSGADNAAAHRWRRHALTQVWGKQGGALAVGARASLATTAKLAPTLRQAYKPALGVRYPTGDLGDALKDTARLIKARVGVEVVTLDYGTWDMHTNVGTLASTGHGSMKAMVDGLAKALAAFFDDLGALTSKVTLVTLTEFGRRLAENGTNGLDHGWANATFVLGGGVKGGAYHGTWPGLGSANLKDGDLAVTTDYRDVLTEVVGNRFGSVNLSTVFPGFKPANVGVMA